MAEQPADDHDEELDFLINRQNPERASSETAVPTDEQLKDILERIEGVKVSRTLPWTRMPEGDQQDAAWVQRLSSLGFKVVEDESCWQWVGAKANNGRRPQYQHRQAYLFTLAAWQNAPYKTDKDWDVDHRCGNSLCVRPGAHSHAQPNLRSLHQDAEREGLRPQKPIGDPKKNDA